MMTNDDIYRVLCSINQKLSWDVDSQQSGQVETALQNINSPGQFVGQNGRRTELWVLNDADRNLYLTPYSGGLDEQNYSVRLYPGATLILNADSQKILYQGAIFGFWDEGYTGTARITEFYLQR